MHRTSALKRVGHAEILASGNIRPEEDEATRIDICPATGHSDKPNRKVTIEKSRIVHYWVVNLKP